MGSRFPIAPASCLIALAASACGGEVNVTAGGTSPLCLEWERDEPQPPLPPAGALDCHVDPAVGRDFELAPGRTPNWNYVCVESEGEERSCPGADVVSSRLAGCFVTRDEPDPAPPGMGGAVGELGIQERLIETCGPDDGARGACCYWVDLLNERR